MSSSLDLQTLEQNCETLYNPSSPSSRIQAESFLNYYCPTFSIESGANSNNALDATHAHNSCATSPIESALFCRNILENSKNPYALMFATTRLRSLVESHFTTFSITEQHGLRTFVLQYIYQKPDLPPFILAAQAQLLAIITKLGWLQNEGFRTLLDSVQPFFQLIWYYVSDDQHGVDHRIIGVRILAAIATEMNILGSHNVLKNRKSAVGFRDTQLLPIFQVALDMLRAVLRCQLSGTDTEKLKEAILILIKACLGFDFIGTSYEESLDDVGSIQVPAAWRSVFEESGYLDILWECWKAFSAPVSALVMECLSQAASIRRSIFTDDNTRHSYVCHIMRETLWTMNTAAGQNKLQDVGNFHEFSRMLSRFKSTFRLAETCDYSEAEQWLTAIGEFTAQGFHSWKVLFELDLEIPGIMSVSGLSSAKQETERLIERITVKLTRAFLKSCLECVYAVMDGEADDPLESEEALLPLLEMFADIARTKYSESGQIICTEFKDLLLKYQDLLQRATTGPGNPSRVPVSNDIKESLMVVQLQLTWIVYIMAACIGGRVMYQSTSEQDQMDGEFACEVLGFIHQLRISTTQMPLYISSPDAHLYIQSSIIYFYIQFRSSYIDEDTAKAGKVYIQLAARWGLNTPSQVLNVIMNSSLGNLRSSGNPAWRKQEDQLVFRTLKLFTTLSSGYSSVKFIRKLDTTKALLKNHSPSEFQFLNPKSRNPSSDMGQCRTIYYKMLSQILFSEDNVDADFWRFVKPWETILDQILVAFEGGGGLNEEDIQLTLLGVFKDLRGFVTSISNRKQFNLFHEWFFAAYSPIALRAIEIWPQSELAITVLRFWQEFATNKSSRVTFDSSSADGILLFRETRQVEDALL
ncbi:Exportin 7 [Lobosporangium transversale]|nr:Exportin 7 [Lobosporangium transversale]